MGEEQRKRRKESANNRATHECSAADTVVRKAETVDLRTAYEIGLTRTTSVKSADRVLSVFELFAMRQRPLRLKDVCSALKIPPSSATELLKSIAARGYISYDRVSRHYFPTQRLCDLGELMQTRLRPESLAVPLDALHQGTGEFIMLGLMNDLNVQYVHTIRSTHVLQFFTPSGVMRPLVFRV